MDVFSLKVLPIKIPGRKLLLRGKKRLHACISGASFILPSTCTLSPFVLSNWGRGFSIPVRRRSLIPGKKERLHVSHSMIPFVSRPIGYFYSCSSVGFKPCPSWMNRGTPLRQASRVCHIRYSKSQTRRVSLARIGLLQDKAERPNPNGI
jgi:hypothetical protein